MKEVVSILISDKIDCKNICADKIFKWLGWYNDTYISMDRATRYIPFE